MSDLEMSTTGSSQQRRLPRLPIKDTTTVDDQELRYRPVWFYVSVLLILFLYAVSIYFCILAILKYATQPIATTISYYEATEASPIAFPAVRICSLSNKKNIKWQKTWWLPSKVTRGTQMKDYLSPPNERAVVNGPPYPVKTQAPVTPKPTQAPTPSPTVKLTDSPTTTSPTVNGSNATSNATNDFTDSPTYAPFSYDYDYVPQDIPDDYNYNAANAAVRELTRNCYTWNDVDSPQMSGNKKDALFMVVDVDLPQRSAKFNTTNCSSINAISKNIDCTPNQVWDAIDSSGDAMGIELTLYPQKANPLDYTTLYIPAATQTKLRMNAKKTNHYNDPNPDWEFVATTSQVFFQTSTQNVQLDAFTANQMGHVATVDQLVFLEIKFGDMSVTEITESKTYEAFNAFGDSTAIFGFFTGFALWGGMNISQMFLFIVAKFHATKRLLFEEDVTKK